MLAAVQRGGEVRARVVANVTTENAKAAMLEWADTSADLLTDDRGFRKIGKPFASHRAVKHSTGEYVCKDDPEVYTNTIEGFFSRVKRQIGGTFHNVSKEHLHRYVAHAAYLYNARALNDGERASHLIQRTRGKRLMYRDPTGNGR